MTTVTQTQDTALAPFFVDERSLVEKLNGTKLEWRPHQPEQKCPAMILGLIIERGTFTSDYGDKELLPTLRVLTEDNVEWSVIGFHGYLRSEIERKNPRVGDFVALAFKGTKPARKPGESDAYDYQLEVERDPDSAASDTVPGVIEAEVKEADGAGDGDGIPF